MTEEILGKPVNGFTEILHKKSGLINKMYDAIQKDDLSDAVMTAFDILNDANLMPRIQKSSKSESQSQEYRIAGNNAFKNELYDEALNYFNLALLYAPKNSESMVLAYSNRSALLFQVKAIGPCLFDIDTCFSIGCRRDIAKKLLARKEKCQLHILQSDFKNSVLISSFGIEYFRFDEKRNEHIPCASADVEVVMEKGFPKVVAARNIECGKVLAIEPAFVADLYSDNRYTACYNCHKLTFNLHPCNGCCYALFCDNNCRDQCMKEYHKIECQIMDVIVEITSNAKCRLPIRAALKVREMSKSWSDFVLTSTKIGSCRMEQSSINEIFDVNNKYSILNFNDEKNFVLGKIFNQSFIYAVILKYIRDIQGYLPQNLDEKAKAMRALARIMLSLHASFRLELDIQNVAQNHTMLSVTSEPEASIGFFAFASKLPHSCEPNLLYVGLNNKLALISSQSIKKGTELTISYVCHWCEVNYADIRASRLFLGAELKCRCRVCVEEWSSFNVISADLTHEQARCMRKWRSIQMDMVKDDKAKFRATCYAFSMAQANPHTKEYYEIFKDFRNKINQYQYSATQNDIL